MQVISVGLECPLIRNQAAQRFELAEVRGGVSDVRSPRPHVEEIDTAADRDTLVVRTIGRTAPRLKNGTKRPSGVTGGGDCAHTKDQKVPLLR